MRLAPTSAPSSAEATSGWPGPASDTCTLAPWTWSRQATTTRARGGDGRVGDRHAAPGVDVDGGTERARARRPVQLQAVLRAQRDVLGAVDHRRRAARADEGPGEVARVRRQPLRRAEAVPRVAQRRPHGRARRRGPRRHGIATLADRHGHARAARAAHEARERLGRAEARGPGRARRGLQAPAPRRAMAEPDDDGRSAGRDGRRGEVGAGAGRGERDAAPRGVRAGRRRRRARRGDPRACAARRSRRCRRRRRRHRPRDRRRSCASARGRGRSARPGAPRGCAPASARPRPGRRSGSPGRRDRREPTARSAPTARGAMTCPPAARAGAGAAATTSTIATVNRHRCVDVTPEEPVAGARVAQSPARVRQAPRHDVPPADGGPAESIIDDGLRPA